MIPLIISADDYAQSPAIDAGIIALIEQGRLTAASCLTLSPRWLDAAKLLTPAIRNKADIGLHLDFTQYGSGIRYDLPMLIARTLSHSLSVSKIRASIAKQLDQFEAALGTPPDYIDGHQHVHQLPQIRDVLLDIVTQRYSANLPWIRIARPPAADGFKARVIAVLGAAALEQRASEVGLRCNSTLLGVYGFDVEATAYRQKLSQWLEIACKGSGNGIYAFMCHPAIASDRSEIGDPIYKARLQEYQVFASEDFSALLAQHGIESARGNALESADKK